MKKTVVLVGGGHTHALVLNALRKQPIANGNVILINPTSTAPYSGMLPGFVAGHYSLDELNIDLFQLCEKVGVRLIQAKAVSMDGEAKTLLLDNGSEVPFDVLSFDVGITSEMNMLEGFAEHAVPAKPLAEFASCWDAFRLNNTNNTVAVIGGGIAGVELAMAMAFALRSRSFAARVRLIDRATVLTATSKSARSKILQALARNSVEVIENSEVINVDEQGVQLGDGSVVEAKLVVGAAGATPHSWVSNTGLRLEKGFIAVDQNLKASHDSVFAVGDCAHMSFNPRPKAGVYAVRQAPILLENIKRLLDGREFLRYAPQSDYLKLVSLGDKLALGEKRGWVFSGRMVWKLKDRIDRAFMDQF